MALNKSCWPLWRIEMDALISWIVPLERPLSNPMGPQAANSIAQRTSSKTCVYCDSIICFLFFRVNQRRPQSGVQTLWGLQPAIGCIPWSWICTLEKWQAVETRFCSKKSAKKHVELVSYSLCLAKYGASGQVYNHGLSHEWINLSQHNAN